MTILEVTQITVIPIQITLVSIISIANYLFYSSYSYSDYSSYDSDSDDKQQYILFNFYNIDVERIRKEIIRAMKRKQTTERQKIIHSIILNVLIVIM